MSTIPASASSQNITLPDIPELFNENFLDILLPRRNNPDITLASSQASTAGTQTPRNAMIDALEQTTKRTFTANFAPAFSSTMSDTLDAFNNVNHHADGDTIASSLRAAWKESPELTLRIIWCLRSIPDGKANKEGFYRAFGWLLEEHPRTAIVNLPLLFEPVSFKRKTKTEVPHGYWKDLLNIVAMAACDELSPQVSHSNFLHSPKMTYTYPLKKTRSERTGTPEERIAAHLANNASVAAQAKAKRAEKRTQAHERLVSKLQDPKFRALYIAVARHFASQLSKDLSVYGQIAALQKGQNSMPLLRKLSLAGKWAPTPGGSHDKVTNLSSAIALLLLQSQHRSNLPRALNDGIDSRDKLLILRSFYNRWCLVPLREALQVPETRMATNRWSEIRYTRVPSICMKNNTELFYKHDLERFEKYLIDVESGKKTISGATLMPHELVGSILKNGAVVNRYGSSTKTPALQAVKQKLAETQMRVAESQWKTLVDNLRASGSLDNCIAVCDVSGSMGSIYSKPSKSNPQPIHPAVALSLILAYVAKPPFNGGFITFSASPEYVKLDPENKSLYENITEMVGASWGYNTDINAVFLKLLLPLAKQNNMRQEDMIKRIFIFSDMQFDEANSGSDQWETNYEVIEREYKEAGYEVPQIVYWDLNTWTAKTVEVHAEKKGVAMMNGFSPSLLKVFMGEEEEEGWDMAVDAKGEEAKPEDEFNPLNVMKKALSVKSFDRLVVVD